MYWRPCGLTDEGVFVSLHLISDGRTMHYATASPNVGVHTGYSSICITEVTQSEASALLTVPYSKILFNLWSFCKWRSNAYSHSVSTAWLLFKGPFVQGALWSRGPLFRTFSWLSSDRWISQNWPRCHNICMLNLNSRCSWSNSHWICHETISRGLCQPLGLTLTRQVLQLIKGVLLLLLRNLSNATHCFLNASCFLIYMSDVKCRYQVDWHPTANAAVFSQSNPKHVGGDFAGILEQTWQRKSLSWEHMLSIHGAGNLKLQPWCLHIAYLRKLSSHTSPAFKPDPWDTWRSHLRCLWWHMHGDAAVLCGPER